MGRVRDRMDQDMAMRGLSANTRKTYLYCTVAFVRHFTRPPSELGTEQIRAFLLHLLLVKKCAASTIGVHVGALRFLYFVTLRRRDMLLADCHGSRVRRLLSRLRSLPLRRVRP